jgi:glycosyltransferase involved in cell wall biosynthesis
MRVVILYNTSWYVFLLRRNLIAHLLEAGCEVIVVAPRDKYTDRLLSLGVRFISIPLEPGSTSPLSELKTLRSVHRTLRALRPDAVLSFTIKCNLYAGLTKRLVPFKQVANISGLGMAFENNGVMRRVAHVLYKVAMAPTDHIFFQNQEDLQSCLQHSLVPRNNSRTIPGSGVDLEAFVPTPRIAGRARTFLMFGRLLPKKGYDLYLQAAQRLRTSFGDNVAFWILGSPDLEREESRALYRRIMNAHGSGTVRYLQSSDDVRPVLDEADVVVLPSTYNEGIPRSLLEALASGKAIITTDWKGCRETVEHGTNGYLVPPHDAESLYAAMRLLATCSDATLASFGKASRDRAEHHFDERLVLQAYLEALALPVPSKDIPCDMKPTGTHA